VNQTIFDYEFTNASYVMLNLNASTMPMSLRQGGCLPRQCTQGMYNEFSGKASVVLTSLIQKFLKKIKLNWYALPADV
jgi:hypothetical protein